MNFLSEHLGDVELAGLLVLLLLAVLAFISFKRGNPAPRATAIFGAMGAAIVLLILFFVDPSDRWGWVLALMPAVVIIQHAVFLRLIRMPFRKPMSGVADSDSDAVKRLGSNESLTDVFAAARRNSERYFSASTLAVRYGTPAVAVAIAGTTLFYMLFRDVGILSPVETRLHAAKLGLSGAYVYILMYLGQRNFRHDVTSGGAMWCAVLLVVGPVLAWAVSFLAAADLKNASASDVGSDLIYLAAGLAPKHVVGFLDEAARRLWTSPNSTTTATPRTIPITQLRGVTSGIAERLAEEGIFDLYGLASADPLRLIRNTNFDKRQILSWIDEAILVTVFPDNWQLLEKYGFTGAIDVAWLQANGQAGAAGIDIIGLAKLLKLDEAAILTSAIERLASDAQLQLVWVLYQAIDKLDARDEQA